MGNSPIKDVAQSPGLAGAGGTVTPVGVHTEAAINAEKEPGKRQLRKGSTSSKGKAEIARELRELQDRAKNVTIQSRTKVYIRFPVTMSCYRALVELAEARGIKMTVVQQECIEAGIRKWKNLPQRGMRLGMALGDRLDELEDQQYGEPEKGDAIAASYADFVRQEKQSHPAEYAGWVPASAPVITGYVPPEETTDAQ